MNKVQLGPSTILYPMPALLIGANVDGKPNFMTAAWSGIACSDPPMLTVAVQHRRFTYQGIKETGFFSVNVPSTEMVREADYCGIVTGEREDKVATCHFNVFYGAAKSAPLIEQCPVNLECRLMQNLNLGTHALLIGRIEEVHVSEECLSDGKPDIVKINPLIFSVGADRAYYSIGLRLAKAFSIGSGLSKSKA